MEFFHAREQLGHEWSGKSYLPIYVKSYANMYKQYP